MCRLSTKLCLGLCLILVPAVRAELILDDEKYEIAAAEMLLTRAWFDTFKLQDFGLDDAQLDFDVAISTDSFAYSFHSGATYHGLPLVLSGTGQRNGDQWTGRTTGSLGDTPIDMPWVSNIAWRTLGADCDWHTGRGDWEPDETWTIDYSGTGGFATSTHEGGGEDRGVRRDGKMKWTLLKAPEATAKADLSLPLDYPGVGTGTLSFGTYVVPEPASSILLACGAAGLLLTRRRR